MRSSASVTSASVAERSRARTRMGGSVMSARSDYEEAIAAGPI
jgi:hypothetical protein